MKKYSILTILFLFFLASCSEEGNITTAPEDLLLLNQSISVEGTEWAYHLFVPNETVQKSFVVLLHGNGGDYNQVGDQSSAPSPEKVWLSIAAEDSFLLLIPNGTLGTNNRRGWNDCRNDAPDQTQADDVALINKLLTDLKTQYDYDQSRVYISGVSNGFISQRLAQEIPVKITAAASIIASTAINTEFTNSEVPISVLFMNGTDDPLTHYDGGQNASGSLISSTAESINYWTDRNGITEDPTIATVSDINFDDDYTIEKITYSNGLENTEVVLYKINGGGHTDPSISGRYGPFYLSLVGNQNGDIEMATEIWNFFKNKSHANI
jgi:polyhydroxybutyrate depolymerase